MKQEVFKTVNFSHLEQLSIFKLLKNNLFAFVLQQTTFDIFYLRFFKKFHTDFADVLARFLLVEVKLKCLNLFFVICSCIRKQNICFTFFEVQLVLL